MAEKNPDELGALWEKTSARGVYFTGSVNGERIVVFKNEKKAEGSKAPDWRILRAKTREAVDGGNVPF